MTMQTYRVEIAESDGADGIDVDCYDEDGLVTESVRLFYDEFGLDPADRDGSSPTVVREVTADVTTLDLQYERDGAGFSFRLLGDRDELLNERVVDEEWGIGSLEESE